MDNYSQSNATTPTGAAQQVPVIEVIARQLEKQLAELSEIISALEGRLAPVMREPEPSAPAINNRVQNAPAQSMIGSMLNQRDAEAESLTYRLSAILRRLEI